MTTKLTLTVEKEIIERAKSYAKQTGRSLSELIEKYLQNLINEDKSKKDMNPKLKKIIGSVRLPKNFDEKKELSKYYKSKHG